MKNLKQEWKLLKHWVDEEYEAAVIYQRLVEDSIAYYQDAVQKGSLSEGKVTDPKIPTLTDTFKETGATMWGQLKELIAQFGFLFFR